MRCTHALGLSAETVVSGSGGGRDRCIARADACWQSSRTALVSRKNCRAAFFVSSSAKVSGVSCNTQLVCTPCAQIVPSSVSQTTRLRVTSSVASILLYITASSVATANSGSVMEHWPHANGLLEHYVQALEQESPCLQHNLFPALGRPMQLAETSINLPMFELVGSQTSSTVLPAPLGVNECSDTEINVGAEFADKVTFVANSRPPAPGYSAD